MSYLLENTTIQFSVTRLVSTVIWNYISSFASYTTESSHNKEKVENVHDQIKAVAIYVGLKANESGFMLASWIHKISRQANIIWNHDQAEILELQ